MNYRGLLQQKIWQQKSTRVCIYGFQFFLSHSFLFARQRLEIKKGDGANGD